MSWFDEIFFIHLTHRTCSSSWGFYQNNKIRFLWIFMEKFTCPKLWFSFLLWDISYDHVPISYGLVLWEIVHKWWKVPFYPEYNSVSTIRIFKIRCLKQGWPTRGPRAACGPERNFCGPIFDWNSVNFRYFECFPLFFVKIWPKNANIFGNFPKCGPETDLGWPPLV